ncbi:DUF1934 domain-containing protein [Clostridium butyricum]|uniref:DUF1934 domain-containing protein n=1 Tax=Clostridium butyricum TaxID=1492 RepID=A0A2S7F7S4_CLOBU|nr:DUF1934 domain-containing protein [Clostridium butyricum]PPV13148.1 hypothetical protein AWN73_17000 [Clostridium butyricum]
MVKNAVVTVQSRVSVEDELIEVVTPGKFYITKSGYKIEYEETKLSGMEGTKTTMIIKNNYFKLNRVGTTETNMEFEINKQSVSLYKTPFGAMSVVIDTKSLEINVDDDGGIVHIVYTLNVEGQQLIETDLNVIIKA